MSGFVGIVSLDGAPVETRLLDRMTRSLAPRGPDAQDTWLGAGAGFGHALLRTTWESAAERQPLSLDGRTFIVADCRVDARQDLIRALADQGCAPDRDATDPELILRAYRVWADRCCEHLLGDYSFAVWDADRRTLFCGRDHFGVKPLFYACAGEVAVVSNDLGCLRLHPAIPSELDETAIADFLVHGYPLDVDRSSFAAIRRLPPAHTLSVVEGRPTVRRYWQIPLEDEIRYRRRGEYVEHFLELLEVATRDRLRTDRVGVLMSGGMDSPTVTAMTHRVMAASARPFDLRAHTIVFDHLVPDEERRYSQLAANHIGIPIHHYPFDDHGFPPSEPEPDWYPPEPKFVFDRGRAIAVHRGPAASARVLLRADGADPLIDAGPAVAQQFAAGRYGYLLKETLWLAWARRQIPRIGLRSLIRQRLGRAPAAPVERPYPTWLAPALERRLGVRDRWEAFNAEQPVRPGLELALSYWPQCLESLDLGSMRLAAEVRYPFLDVRLARYLLRLPPIPWGTQKGLLRIAMKGLLPAAILRRPKAPLAGNPWALLVPPAHTRWWEPYLTSEFGLENFVDVGAARATLAEVVRATQRRNAHEDIDVLRMNLLPLSLNVWLRQTLHANVSFSMETRDEVMR